jgi:long-chain acyl-CoA synthetase
MEIRLPDLSSRRERGLEMANTLNERFLEIVSRKPEATAFLVKIGGEWKSFTFEWAMKQVQRTAFGFLSIGLEAGDRVALLSENRPEWTTTDFAAMAVGCMIVPLYTTLIPEQVEYILNDAEVRVAAVSTMGHLRTILSIRDRIPSLEKVVVFSPEGLEEDEFVISLDTLKARGDDHRDGEFEELARRAKSEDGATFVYTSGTTGDPKGVVLSHGNFTAEFAAVAPCIGNPEGRDIAISFLPLSHILQRVVDLYSHLLGVTLAYVESMETLGETLREVRPTHLVAVPRVFEKIHSRIYEGVKQGSAVKRAVFRWAQGVGSRFRAAESRGAVSWAMEFQHSIADRLVFRKIRAATGGQVRVFISTGAPLAKFLAEFFHSIGIQILELWGMTELTGAATINTTDDFRYGSVGKPGPGVTLKFTDEGEICVRGDLVMQGYWRKPKDTAETITADGWLYTGDVGHRDEEGFIHITDRIKELIVTAGGKNVAPQPLENAIKADELVSQVMVIGDKRNFISALIVPDKEALKVWAHRHGVTGDMATLCTNSVVRTTFRERLAVTMEGFSRYERVKRFELVPDEFTQESGELTPTLKLKRRILLEEYGELIDRMYTMS